MSTKRLKSLTYNKLPSTKLKMKKTKTTCKDANHKAFGVISVAVVLCWSGCLVQFLISQV